MVELILSHQNQQIVSVVLLWILSLDIPGNYNIPVLPEQFFFSVPGLFQTEIQAGFGCLKVR